MSHTVSYAWKPIEDLPSDLDTLRSTELPALVHVWEEQRARLEQTEALRIFNERLQRQWAIETGIIERIYSLDRGTTQILIEKGLDASLIARSATDKDPALVARILQDHKSAIEGLFDFVKGRRSLSTGYLKELHALLTRHQDTSSARDALGREVQLRLPRGQYKTLPNNPLRLDGTIHEYCPPEHVAAEMDRLLDLHEDHEGRAIPPEVESAWFHHRFSQIHPFQDGNGRVARAASTLLLIKADWLPLVVTNDDRDRYIAALEDADRGNLGPLVDLFGVLIRGTLVSALSIAGHALQAARVDQVIGAAREVLDRRREALRQEWQGAFDTAARLQEITKTHLEDVASKLKAELGAYLPHTRFWVDAEPNDGPRSFWFRRQIIDLAKGLKYHADTGSYRAWVRLVLKGEMQSEILVSFHGLGREYRGVLAASCCFFRREHTETGEREVASVAASDELFQLNYKEEIATAAERFERWLDRALVRALEMWRAGL